MSDVEEMRRISTGNLAETTPMGIVSLHGGLDTSREREYMAILEEAALKGHALLARGRVDALEGALKVLEDSPRFNCGYGSVLNLDGEVEMDAAIADGGTVRFAAVAAIKSVMNPISVARKLMEETKQVILAGDGATKFARIHGFPEANCITREQLDAWREAKDSLARGELPRQNLFTGLEYHDTVGCVVWDGTKLAAASSTGGCSLKLPGRVGDTSALGGGVFASRNSAAVCTGVGEAFVETLTARYVDDLIAEGAHPQEAVESALRRLADLKGAEGGILAIDYQGRIGAAFNAGRFPVVVVVDGKLREDLAPVNLRPGLNPDAALGPTGQITKPPL